MHANTVGPTSIYQLYTLGWFLIEWFDDCVLGKSGQIVNPIIANVAPYRIIVYANVYVCKSINCDCRKSRNSQLIDTRN